MFNGNIISVDTPDNHSIFMDLFRNELETMLNTLLLAELTEFFAVFKPTALTAFKTFFILSYPLLN